MRDEDPVLRAFAAAVARAEAARRVGELGLLAGELDGLEGAAWRAEARRRVARALERLGARSRAREVWASLLAELPDDPEARRAHEDLARVRAHGGPAVPAAPGGTSAGAASAPSPVIVGTGHRPDAPGRDQPRFPDTPTARAAALEALRGALRAELGQGGASRALGLAAAASGADLLFHQAADELGLATRVLLPIPIAEFRRRSVEDGGPEWLERFRRVVASRPVDVLQESAELPPWVAGRAGASVFGRGNLWLLESAFALAGAGADGAASGVALVALWDGQGGDGPGGTAHMVALARERGARAVVLDARSLLGAG